MMHWLKRPLIAVAMLLAILSVVAAQQRQTPTVSNYGASIFDDTYADLVNAEITALWGNVAEPLGSVAGTNTITATTTPALTSYSRKIFIFKPAAANTGGVTLNINTLGAKNLLTQYGAALASGALDPSAYYAVYYDGAAFRMLFTQTAQSLPPLPLNYLSGFIVSINGANANHAVDITAGQARDAANAVNMSGGAMTKRLDLAWTAGSGNGATLQSAALTGTILVSSAGTGVTGSSTTFTTDYAVGDVITTNGGQSRRITAISSNTAMTITPAWSSTESGVAYKRGGKSPNSIIRIFAIYKASDGSVDYAASTRDVPTDMPAGYTGYRRIEYVLTDASANDRSYVRTGDRLDLTASVVLDGTFTIAASTTRAVSSIAPPNVVARYTLFATYLGVGAGTQKINVRSTFQQASSFAGNDYIFSTPCTTGAPMPGAEVALDSSSQFAIDNNDSAATQCSLSYSLRGWTDRRGQ